MAFIFSPLNHFFLKFVLHLNDSLVKYRLLYIRQRFSILLLGSEMFGLLFFCENIFWQTANFFTAKGYIKYGAAQELRLS